MAHVVHFEISVPNPERAVEFFSIVFGWSAEKLPDPVRYWQLKPTASPGVQGIPGGILESKTGQPRTSVTIQVESLEHTCAKVRDHGGTVVTEPRLVPGYGTHVLCKDAQGIFFALIEPLSRNELGDERGDLARTGASTPSNLSLERTLPARLPV